MGVPIVRLQGSRVAVSFRSFLAGLPALALLATLSAPAPASAQGAKTGPDSGLPLPRFVSLKSGQANVRVGPGRDYRVEWVFTRPGLPLEIVAEYDNWRRIRDAEGSEGWIFGALLSGRRTAVAAPWLLESENARPEGGAAATPDRATLALRRKPAAEARVVARLEPGVVGTVVECDGEWCRFQPHASKGEVTGWMRQIEIWGAYPGEVFED